MTPITPKKRGAPKGNKNAHKHGFYSLAYTQSEGRELSQLTLDYRQDNIKFFKVLIARTAQRIKPSASHPLSFHENVTALHTVVLAVSRLHSALHRKHQILTDKEADYEKGIVEFCLRYGMTQEQIDAELFGILPVRAGRTKRGGQPANRNALKHGFFASAYTLEELRQLEQVDDQDSAEEIALLQVLMKRVFLGLKDDLPPLDYLRAIRVLSFADACLERLNRERGQRMSPSALFRSAIDEVLKLDPYDPNTLE